MTLTLVKNLVATIGENGEGKKFYHKVGALYQRDDGSEVIKINSIPVSPDWKGWLNLYEPRDLNEVDEPTS